MEEVEEARVVRVPTKFIMTVIVVGILLVVINKLN